MGLVAIIGAVALATLGKLTGDEIKAWLPSIAKNLTTHAVCRLPEAKRERYVEEWTAHLGETPGDLGKVAHAFGFICASYHIKTVYLPNVRWRLLFQNFDKERELINSMFLSSLHSKRPELPLDSSLHYAEIFSIENCIPFSMLLKLRALRALRPVEDWALRFGRQLTLTVQASCARAEQDKSKWLSPDDKRFENAELQAYWVQQTITRLMQIHRY